MLIIIIPGKTKSVVLSLTENNWWGFVRVGYCLMEFCLLGFCQGIVLYSKKGAFSTGNQIWLKLWSQAVVLSLTYCCQILL